MKREEILQKVIKNMEEELGRAPEGQLQYGNDRGKTRYFQIITSSEPEKRYIRRDNTELLQALQEKSYYEKVKRAAENELALLKKMQKKNSRIITFEEVFFSIPEIRRTMIKPYELPEHKEVKNKIERQLKIWEKNRLERKGVDKDINLVTLNGERVRSKSELIIADRLKAAGVPYYYEAKYLYYDKKVSDYSVRFPDFQALNTRTGEVFFWEHLGIMDDPGYCARSQSKLEMYAQHGIIVGKNLILSMESSQHTLNVDYVDILIKTFLV